jgi:tetrahydromethanopterin S-methyltransferase subunit G
MIDEPMKIVLTRLDRLDEKLDLAVGSIVDLTQRIDLLETQVAQIRTDLAVVSNHVGTMEARLDRIEKRVDLVERRAFGQGVNS